MENQTHSADMAPSQAPKTDHLDGTGYLFGYPIAHSMSPLLHQTIFTALGLNRDYFLLPSLDMAHFLSLVRDPKCYGKLPQSCIREFAMLTYSRIGRHNAAQSGHNTRAGCHHS